MDYAPSWLVCALRGFRWAISTLVCFFIFFELSYDLWAYGPRFVSSWALITQLLDLFAKLARAEDEIPA